MQIDPEDPEDTVAARPAARPIGGVNKDALTRPRKDSWMMIQNVVKSAQAEPTVVAPAATSGSNSPLGSLLAAPNKAWTKAKSLVSSKSFRALISSMPDAVEVEREQKRVSWQRLKADRDRKDALFEQIVFALRAQYKAAIRRSDHATQCSVSVNISRSYFKAGRLPEAETWLTQALDICVEQDLSKPIFLGALRSLVQFHLEALNLPKAITNGSFLLRAAQDAQEEHFQGEAYRLLAAAHMAQGNYEKARDMDAKHLVLALKEASWEVETAEDSACGTRIKGDSVRGDSATAWEALGLQPGPVGHQSAAGRYLSSVCVSRVTSVASGRAASISGNDPILQRISSTARRLSHPVITSSRRDHDFITPLITARTTSVAPGQDLKGEPFIDAAPDKTGRPTTTNLLSPKSSTPPRESRCTENVTVALQRELASSPEGSEGSEGGEGGEGNSPLSQGSGSTVDNLAPLFRAKGGDGVI